MTDRELLQMALDLLEDINQCSLPPTGIFLPAEIDHVMEALRARLAQPENKFNPDWDAMAVMVEEQQRMAKRVEELEAQLAQPEPKPVAWTTDLEFDHDTEIIPAKIKGRLGTSMNDIPLYTAPPQPESEPVAWVSSLDSAQPHCVTDLKYCTVLQHERGEHLKYIPVYTVPPPRVWALEKSL